MSVLAHSGGFIDVRQEERDIHFCALDLCQLEASGRSRALTHLDRVFQPEGVQDQGMISKVELCATVIVLLWIAAIAVSPRHSSDVEVTYTSGLFHCKVSADLNSKHLAADLCDPSPQLFMSRPDNHHIYITVQRGLGARA